MKNKGKEKRTVGNQVHHYENGRYIKTVTKKGKKNVREGEKANG